VTSADRVPSRWAWSRIQQVLWRRRPWSGRLWRWRHDVLVLTMCAAVAGTTPEWLQTTGNPSVRYYRRRICTAAIRVLLYITSNATRYVRSLTVNVVTYVHVMWWNNVTASRYSVSNVFFCRRLNPGVTLAPASCSSSAIETCRIRVESRLHDKHWP